MTLPIRCIHVFFLRLGAAQRSRGEGQDEGLAGADRFIRRQAADAWFCRNGLWSNSALVTLTPSLSLLRALRLQGEGSDSFSLAAFFAAGEMGL